MWVKVVILNSSCPIPMSHKKRCFINVFTLHQTGGGRVQKLRENLYDTNELKFLKSLDIMWERGRVLTLYPLNSLGSVVSARPRQMIPGRGVKDTRAQAASAAVQGGSWIVVLTPEYWELWSIEYSAVYTSSMSSVTSHNTDMGTWNIWHLIRVTLVCERITVIVSGLRSHNPGVTVTCSWGQTSRIQLSICKWIW